ncbi:hypothetical protein GCM10010413_57110 [Promicromonospora sukumoe]|uniref:Uncharacterized protein n=1 Tax=Promicromonospora sukumoe TaxID=88382 RepID=A0A7W3PFV4_9MICO|nr:hypothetical protein [Promicromonospora sukumoe]MBA8810313.1 hypothetical protein [Promicromonospora sukumoe]
MTTEPEFVPLTFVEADHQKSARFSAEIQVTPWIDRRPPESWVYFFEDECRKMGIHWLSGGFAICRSDDVDAMPGGFTKAVERANNVFKAYLVSPALDQRGGELSDISEKAAQSEPGGLYRVVVSHIN